MHRLLSNVKIQVPETVFQKDPESTELGRRILQYSIKMIEELGFEAFTFKKLGDEIGSPESTIYRYFTNKHKLLVYLTSWYWGWLEYKVVFSSANVDSPGDRLERAIRTVTESVAEDGNFSHISETLLQRIVIAESSKAFLSKDVDEENKQGYFANYKRLCTRLSELVLEVQPNYPFPHTLVSTVIEGCHLQRFFSKHLPGLTDTYNDEDAVVQFFVSLTSNQLRNGQS